MVLERVCGNIEDIVLQLFQRCDAEHFFVCFRVAEDKVTETHMLLYHLTQVDIELLRVLIQEIKTFGPCFITIGYLRTLKD